MSHLCACGCTLALLHSYMTQYQQVLFQEIGADIQSKSVPRANLRRMLGRLQRVKELSLPSKRRPANLSTRRECRQRDFPQRLDARSKVERRRKLAILRKEATENDMALAGYSSHAKRFCSKCCTAGEKLYEMNGEYVCERCKTCR